jgi:paraquat-inducible protein B
VLYFDESLRGLSFGAPVTLRGLTVGEVTDIGLEFDPKSLQLRGRVEIITSPQRFSQRLRDVAPGAIESLLRDPQQRHALISALVERRGLRAQLRTGNLLTGQVYVAFEFQPGAPRATVDWKSEPVQLPVVPSALGDLEQRLARILARVDAIPFDAIGGEAKTALASINTLVRDADQAIKRLDNDVIPAVKPALEAFRNAAAAAEQAIRAADASLLGADTPAQQELRQALQEVTRAARALRVLADYLETNPAALIRGKADKP